MLSLADGLKIFYWTYWCDFNSISWCP